MIPFKDDNPTRSFPLITILLIIINVAVFLYQEMLTPGFGVSKVQMNFIYHYAAVPEHILHGNNLGYSMLEPAWLTIFTSMFMHGDWLHLIFNMLFLWVFGNNIEDIMGKPRFIVFYLLCGLAAAGLQIFMSMSPPASGLPMLGASGAVAGVLGAYTIKFPTARVRTLLIIIIFIQVIVLPAWFVLGFWFVGQFLSAMSNAAHGVGQGGVAFFAHVGGFVAGMLLVNVFAFRKQRRW